MILCFRVQLGVPTEMFVPLSHAPGHAQCDFGESLVAIGGVEQKTHCFVIDLPHSDGCFVKAYPAETTEAFLDDHVSAFTFLGGVPHDRRQFVLPVLCCLLTNRTMKRDSWPPSSEIPAATHRWSRFARSSSRRSALLIPAVIRIIAVT